MKIFWSYARRDDASPSRKVFNLKQTFEIILSQTLGDDCEIFFDKVSLKWGVQWQKDIDVFIKGSDFFVAIITPSFFKSKMCIYELQQAKENGIKILPIYFRTCKAYKSTFKEDGRDSDANKILNAVSLNLSEIQRFDFRDFRNMSLNCSKVENFLDRMAEEVTEVQ